jgi:L-alanine-DL-glutamate epimerase-like enolase superfamily enzyme
MDSSTVRATLFPLRIPVRAGFTTAGGPVGTRRVALVRLGDGGAEGWGEAAPYPGQDEPFDLMLEAAATGRTTPTLAAAVDEASADLAARRAGMPLSSPSTATLPTCVAVGIDDAVERVDALVRNGVARFKIKVAPGAIEHVRLVRERHPGIVIGVDGNGSFGDLDRHDLGIFHEAGLAFAEELFTDWVSGGAEMFVEMTGVPLFADESVRSVEDASRMLSLPAVGGITVKPGRHGWTGASVICDAALSASKLWRASGLLETGVGRAFTNRLAADESAFLSDVAPASVFLATDVIPDVAVGAEVAIPDGPGIGVQPDRSALVHLADGPPIDIEVTVS